MYQFDNLMKELTSHNLTDPDQHVSFSCDSPQDDENSNETDLIRTIRKKSLPSIGSLITQHQQLNGHVIEGHHCPAPEPKPIEPHFDPSVQNDMEWADTEFLRLCEEFDDANNLFGNKLDHKSMLSKHSHASTDLLVNGSSNSYLFENNNQQSSYLVNQPVQNQHHHHNNHHHHNHQQQQQNYQQQLMYSHHNLIGFDPNSLHSQQMNQSHLMNGQLLNEQNHQQATSLLDLNGNASAGAMLPWEFESDLHQIATYLQTPTV